MRTHIPAVGIPVPCGLPGRCRICELIATRADYAAFFSGTPPTPPGPLAKAVNLGKAIVTHAAAGMPRADDATFGRRMATCRACPRFDAERTACNACGCHLDVKARWKDQACPEGRW